jgi:hypothetical protein
VTATDAHTPPPAAALDFLDTLPPGTALDLLRGWELIERARDVVALAQPHLVRAFRTISAALDTEDLPDDTSETVYALLGVGAIDDHLLDIEALASRMHDLEPGEPQERDASNDEAVRARLRGLAGVDDEEEPEDAPLTLGRLLALTSAHLVPGDSYMGVECEGHPGWDEIPPWDAACTSATVKLGTDGHHRVVLIPNRSLEL